MDIQIRAGDVTDLPKLLQLQRESLEALSGEAYSPRQIQALVTHQGEARALIGELLFVAEVEGAIVGFSSLDYSYRQIQSMFVDPNWVRLGVGSQLIAHMEALAKARGTQRLIVMSSLTAIPFYVAQGYERAGATGFRTSHEVWIPCLYMDKLLVPATELPPVIPLKSFLGGILLLAVLSTMLFYFWPQRPSQPQETLQPNPIWTD